MGKKRLTYWGLLPLAVLLLAGCMADYEERPDATGGGLDGLVPIYMTASVLETEADKGGAGGCAKLATGFWRDLHRGVLGQYDCGEHYLHDQQR